MILKGIAFHEIKMASVQGSSNALLLDRVNFPVIVYENQLIDYIRPVHPVINIIASSN